MQIGVEVPLLQRLRGDHACVCLGGNSSYDRVTVAEVESRVKGFCLVMMTLERASMVIGKVRVSVCGTTKPFRFNNDHHMNHTYPQPHPQYVPLELLSKDWTRET